MKHEAYQGKLERLIDAIDNLDDEILEKSPQYFESIRDKAAGILETIETTLRVTQGQQKAVDNIIEGFNKWMHDDADKIS